MAKKIRRKKSSLESQVSLSSVAPVARQVTRNTLRSNVTQLAARGSVAELEILLEAGEDANSRSPNGTSALELAAKYGQAEAVQLLLKFGATARQQALSAARHAGHEEIVECLQQHLNTIRQAVSTLPNTAIDGFEPV